MKKDTISLHFLGATSTVTGSKYVVDTGEHKIMIDCGLFQGLKELRRLNWNYLPVQAEEINMVLLTHGHMDHTAFLPRLVKMGFKGKIYGTTPTLTVAAIILRDSAKIQEEEAERANQKGYSKRLPAEPLYTLKEAERAIAMFSEYPEGEWREIYDGVRARFQYNGHIIGATFIELIVHEKRFVFSGDIGRKEDPLLKPYKKPERADVLLIESTYGDRIHDQEDVKKKLQKIIVETIEREGTVIIPSFAVERTQVLMYLIWKLQEEKSIPNVPLIMDSPMGANVLEVFHGNGRWHKLSIEECTKMCARFRIVREYRETWEIIDNKAAKIIIAGSGMMSGGRVLTYLQHYVGKLETSIIIAGYQAAGTRGRKMLEGANEIKIYGKYYPVHAQLHNLEVLSAHADQSELLYWMGDLKEQPEKIYIVHGESKAAKAFQEKIRQKFGWDSSIPNLYSIEEIKLKQETDE